MSAEPLYQKQAYRDAPRREMPPRPGVLACIAEGWEGAAGGDVQWYHVTLLFVGVVSLGWGIVAIIAYAPWYALAAIPAAITVAALRAAYRDGRRLLARRAVDR